MDGVETTYTRAGMGHSAVPVVFLIVPLISGEGRPQNRTDSISADVSTASLTQSNYSTANRGTELGSRACDPLSWLEVYNDYVGINEGYRRSGKMVVIPIFQNSICFSNVKHEAGETKAKSQSQRDLRG